MNASKNTQNKQCLYYCWPRGKQVTYQNDGGYEQNVDEEVSRFGEETRLGLKSTAVAP